MNQAGFLHIQDSRYCFAISDKELVIRLRVAKEDKDLTISLICGNKYHYQERQEEVPVTLAFVDHLHAYFEARLQLSDVRFVYVFKVQNQEETLYYSESGFTKEYDFSIAFYDCFQMPYINPIDVHRVVDWADSAVFYQIFVDRFYRGDTDKDDSYINMAWTDMPLPKSFAGGDLEGIRQKLTYLKDLGINTIYLTPVFKSISNHKYDINDYYEIDRQFGTKISFKALVDDIHALGMRIVMDAVFNHSSHLWMPFQDVLKNGRASSYYDWFMIDGDKPSLEKRNYETFATVAYMPKLNTSNPDVQDYLLEVTRYWTEEFELDGWRLDVSDEVSHDFWRRFRKTVKAINPNLIIIGENWHDAYPYLQGDQFDGIMNYAVTKACLDYFAADWLSSQGMAERLNHILMRNTDAVNRMNLNLLDSHDTHRFLTQVNGSKDKLLAATALLFTFIGIPCLYYGTELGMEGGYDPDCRRGFDWNQDRWDMDLLDKIKSIISLKQNPIIQHGQIDISSEGDLLKINRTWQNQSLQLTINKGPACRVQSTQVHLAHGLEGNTLLQNGFVLYQL